MKAVGRKKSTPIVEFESVNEENIFGDGDHRIVHSSKSLTSAEHENEAQVKVSSGSVNGLKASLYPVTEMTAPSESLLLNGFGTRNQRLGSFNCEPEEVSPPHVVKAADGGNLAIAEMQISIPDKSQDHKHLKASDFYEKQDKERLFECVPDLDNVENSKTGAESLPSVLSLLSEIGRLDLDIGRVQKVYVVHFESPADLYVTPSLEKLKELHK